jgi:predicted O-methyltransferase YrrM
VGAALRNPLHTATKSRARKVALTRMPPQVVYGDNIPPRQLEWLSLRVADNYDNEVRRTLRAMVALIEPALILIFGGLVGFVALAMLQAIYGINLNQL